jgi:hypothetical protein
MAEMTRGTPGVGIVPLAGGGAGTAGAGILGACVLAAEIISGTGGAGAADGPALIVGLGMMPRAGALGIAGAGIATADGPGASAAVDPGRGMPSVA